MVEGEKQDTQLEEGQNNDQKGGEEKKFTQEDIDKAISERLKREQKKNDAKIKELEDKIAKASEKGTEEKSELEQMKELVAEMSKQAELQKKEAEKERFEKQILKYATKYEVDADKALKYLDPSKIEVDEDGNMDFDKTFTEFAELAGKKKGNDGENLGGKPPVKPKTKKSFKEATEAERIEYFKTHGSKAYSEWIGAK